MFRSIKPLCMKCESIQKSQVGTGESRRNYIHPTMYHHQCSCIEHQKKKDIEKEIHEMEEKLIQSREKFTKTSSISHEMASNFSFDRITQLRKQIEEKYSQDFSESNSGCIDELGTETESTDDYTLSIPRSPIECPNTACKKSIGITYVLDHFLTVHSMRNGTNFDDIYAEQISELNFEHLLLKFDESTCLAVLAYGHDPSKSTVQGSLFRNARLPKSMEYLANHTPILIMARRTSIPILYGNEKPDNLAERDVSLDVIIFWLATLPTIRPIYGTMKIFNKKLSESRGMTMEAIDLKKSTNRPTDFLMIRNGEIKRLEDNQIMSLEIVIHSQEEDKNDS